MYLLPESNCLEVRGGAAGMDETDLLTILVGMSCENT